MPHRTQLLKLGESFHLSGKMKSGILRLQLFPVIRPSDYDLNTNKSLPFKTTNHPLHASPAPFTVASVSKKNLQEQQGHGCPPKYTPLLHKPTPLILQLKLKCQLETLKLKTDQNSPKCQSRRVLVSMGVVLLLMGGMNEDKALAFGPEGPLVEEFWDNVRRYALYALTVSTGAIYTIFQPIVELLKNPISAILILAIAGGSIYIVSQVLSAMVGVSEFTYDYGY